MTGFKPQFWPLEQPVWHPSKRGRIKEDSLLNIATGIVLPEEATDRLVDATEIRKRCMEGFIVERKTNQVNLREPLQKLDINTFSTATKKMQAKATNVKFITLISGGELFGRLLLVAKQREVNLREMLSYELSTVPVAIAHGDGSLRKSTKSCFMSVLEKNVTVLPWLPPYFVPTACDWRDGFD